MGLRVAVLTILTALLWITGPYFYSGHKGCLQCHVPHYEAEGRCVVCHRGEPNSNRIHIAHYQLIRGDYACFTLIYSPVVEEGRQLIKKSACRRCHRTGHEGNTLASNLDTSFDKTLPENLADAIKNPARFMPDFYFQGSDTTKLVNAILDSSAVYASESSESVQLIHFEKNGKDSDNIFNQRCGSCHRILTQQYGGLGRGDIGPNLSGLFSRFYFQNFKNGKLWDSNGLKQWLKNSRAIRTNAPMPPVDLKEDQLRQLLTIMSSQETNETPCFMK